MTDDIAGIDLGTTNSLIGVVDAGFPILLADDQGSRLTPSVVYFPKDGTVAIGNPFAEGSRKAVAAGVWKLRTSTKGAVLQRDRYQVVLHRADPENS